ncbi:exported hypothetical protein [Agrobacterium genomosp. 2 str. CFBP 5494]|uniref:Uncharacterized protein n=1 Tax=Agrobacterium genomosp. 2 str. CFBP 5494 TaxID=1183436 RepID=A0A9W5B3U9_9HYPH|nr:exported hypothetical protein [Agrobacterium genomosp. 2 str. CFBP 5494]
MKQRKISSTPARGPCASAADDERAPPRGLAAAWRCLFHEARAVNPAFRLLEAPAWQTALDKCMAFKPEILIWIDKSED